MGVIIAIIIVSVLIAWGIHANDEHAKPEDEAVDVIGGAIVIFGIIIGIIIVIGAVVSMFNQ